VKAPMDVASADRARGAKGSNGQPPVTGKTFLRQAEFVEQRGLSLESRTLTPDGMPDQQVAESSSSLYLRGAQERTALLEAAPPTPAIAWRPLGPAGIPDGQTYGSGPGSTVTVAGRVSAIAVDPTNSDHVLVGSAAGGIWETLDGGTSWTPRTDDQPTLSIGALAFDPSDASTVYAGTGEGNSEYFHLGQGILVSRDGGTTWTIIAQSVFAGIGFYRLVVDPRDGQRLIAATTGGAAVSADGGAGWSLLHHGVTWDVSLAYHGDEAEILLAAPDGLFSARGQGAPAQVQIPDLGALDADRERMAVAHVPSDPAQAFVFAASQGEALLWHRTAEEGPYEPIQLPSFPVGEYVDNVLDVGQAAYDWHVSVPPVGDDTVYLGAIELVKGLRAAGQWDWTDISSRIGEGDSIHPDQHTLAFATQDASILYAGNDGGIFRSPDGGDSWQSLNGGLAISEVEYLTQRPDEPIWMLAGLQDNGTIRREQATAWTQVGLGDGGDCGTNMAHPDVCFHSYYYMYMERSDHRGDADSWVNVTPPGDSPQLLKLFYPPLEVNGEVVAKAGQIVYISRNSGADWKRVALAQPPSGRPSVASALAIPTPDTVLVGTIRGEVLSLRWQNGTWGAPTALTKPRDGWISDLLVDPGNPQRYWATFSNPGAVFRSDDAGATWSDATANLPSAPVNAVISDPTRSDRVWVAGDVGVYESIDAGGSWSVFGTGLPNALAVDLLLYEADRLLRVATRSRGVWEATID
jgi:photosystem II stability/assembly factor-like uncharacterized protein